MREIEDLSSRMSRLLGLTRWTGNGEREALSTTDWTPACDISETGKEYRIQVELPSMKKDDVHVTLEEGVLTIRGERREEKEEKGQRYHRRELAYGNFVRRFTMPSDADEIKVDAAFKDGILTVTVPKSAEKSTKTVEIAVH